MNPYIRIPNITFPNDFDQTQAGEAVDWQAESDAVNQLRRDGVEWVLYVPPSDPPTELSPGQMINFPFHRDCCGFSDALGGRETGGLLGERAI